MEREKPSFKQGIQGILRHARPRGKTFALLIALGFVSAAANGFVPFVTGRFFDALIAVSTGKHASGEFPAWAIFLLVWSLTQFIANVTDWIIDRLRRDVDTKLQLGIQTEGFVHLLELPVSYHTNAHINGVLSKISSGSWRVTAVIRSVVQIVPQFLSVFIGVILAASISVTLASVLALGVFVYCIFMLIVLRPIPEADDKLHTEWNDRWNDAAEAVQQVQYVKQAAAEEHEITRIRGTLMGHVLSIWTKLEHTWSNMSFTQRMIVLLTQFTVFLMSVTLIAQGEITIGELVALNGYAMMFFGPFVQLGYSWQTIQNGLTAAAHLEKVFGEKPEIYRPDGAVVPENHEGRVVFDNVSFEYDDGKESVVNGLSFEVAPGETIGLVGESGSGKSTTLSLLSGYYFPSEGQVLVDGVPTTKWPLRELRRRIAVVPQEVALFNDTLRKNIGYGSFGASDADIESAAQKAHISEFISSLPDGYDTLVGERGVKLSVGQKQRVAIARAILRNPEILILDEPTSALDAKTEQLITESLNELMRGRTTFIIAHRLSTVRRADTILVLENGKISERGSHEALLRKKGAYSRLYKLHIGLHE